MAFEVKPPKRPAHHPDRAADGEEALEDALLAVVEMAEKAGWERAEIWLALACLVKNHVVADLENERLESALRDERVRRLLFPDD